MVKKIVTRKIIFVLCFLLVLSIVSSYLTSIQPRLFQIIVDDGFSTGNILFVVKVLMIVLMLSLINSGIKIFSNMSINKIGLDVSKKLKVSIIKKVFSSPLNFFDRVSNGELVQRIKEVDGISSVFNPQLITFVVSILTSVASLVNVIKIDYRFIFIYLVAFPVLTFISLKFSKTYKNIMYEIVSLNTEYSKIIQESVAGINEVKSNNMGEYRENSLNDINEKIYAKTKRQNTMFAFCNESMITINIIVSCAITLLFVIFLNKGNASVGQYIEITQYTALILAPAQLMSSCVTIFQPICILLQRLKFFEGTSLQENDNGKRIYHIDKIECRDISFTYGQKKVINKLSFCVEKNQKMLIRGKNGSGKTTIIKLLLRLYDDFEGQILFDGDEIQNLSLSDVRDRIGVVFQENFLFDGDIYENIVCGNTNIDIEDVIYALDVSGLLNNFGVSKENAKELLSFPVIEGGRNLSGGQKRMISISRAVLKKPDVLILDEPTTFLDQNSIEGVMNFINSVNDIIMIVISHDEKLVDCFDNVLYLYES